MNDNNFVHRYLELIFMVVGFTMVLTYFFVPELWSLLVIGGLLIALATISLSRSHTRDELLGKNTKETKGNLE